MAPNAWDVGGRFVQGEDVGGTREERTYAKSFLAGLAKAPKSGGET